MEEIENNLLSTCAYYAWVDFGPAMVNGHLDQHENVYRNSGLLKYLRYPGNDPRNFRAFYGIYRVPKYDGFEMINVGPYDTELVAFAALNAVVAKLEQTGYKPKTNAHSMTPVSWDSSVTPC